MASARSAHSTVSQPAATRPLLTLNIAILPSIVFTVADRMPGTHTVITSPVVQHGLAQQPPRVSSAFLDVPQPTRFRPSRKRPIDIFVDNTADSVPQGPSSQRPRLDGRIPLGNRSDSANSTPSPSPRDDAAPYSQSPNDSFWTGQENRDPSPPATPEPFVSASPRNRTTHRNRAAPHNRTAPTGLPPPPPSGVRITRPVRLPRPLPVPQNMVLYKILGLGDWDVSEKQILSAWRHVSLDQHPDRVPEEDRGVATILMQQINAAKEILTNRATRRLYHKSGALPMDM